MENKIDEVNTKLRREAQYFITPLCDLKCKGCNKQSVDATGQLTVEQAKQGITNLYKSGIVGVRFIGGEPFSYQNFTEVLAHATQFHRDGKDFKTVICSNAGNIDEKRYPGQLLSMLDTPPFGYVASVDRIDPSKKVADRDIKSIRGFDMLKLLKKIGKIENLIANIVVSLDNIHEVESTIKILHSEGIKANVCAFVHNNNGKPKALSHDGAWTEINWGFRENNPMKNMFTEADRTALRLLSDKLFEMKNIHKIGITTADDYLKNFADHAILGNQRCGHVPPFLNIDYKGRFNFCNEIAGKVADDYNILTVNSPGKLTQFLYARAIESALEIDCPGCPWSAEFNARASINSQIAGTQITAGYGITEK